MEEPAFSAALWADLRKVAFGVVDGSTCTLTGKMEDALVAASAKLQHQILFFFDKFTVNQDINI